MIATINASKVADNVIESSVDDDLPVYKQVINYVPDYATSANLQSIINAIDFYKLANNGQLPQSDEELESYLSKPIASLGPAGATYAITYFPSLSSSKPRLHPPRFTGQRWKPEQSDLK
jgi:hypothetical protein